jgi:hypothetical protein
MFSGSTGVECQGRDVKVTGSSWHASKYNF